MKKITSNYDTKKSVQARDVDTYLSSVPQELQTVLENLRKAIKTAAPKAEEVISYQIPTYKYHGPLVHFMACKNHCRFIVVSKSIMQIFESELNPFDYGRPKLLFCIHRSCRRLPG